MSDTARVSPAKINLFLEIKGKRPDGYHELFSWMHTIDLADSITIEKSSLNICTLKSDDTAIPFGKRNLCIKAYEALKEETGLSETVTISLEKRIPLGSGLGGGSSNAASILTGCNEIFNLGLDDASLMNIGANVGSDVPFFIAGGSAIASGRGTDISPLPPMPEPIWLVVAKPESAVSTGDAYKWVKGYHGDKTLDVKELADKTSAGDIEYICSILHNSFEPVIFEKHPAVKTVRDRLLAEGCAAAQMSGSGSSVFGLCENETKARAVMDAISNWDKLSFVRACRMI